jgi:hypothetical protein
MNYKLEGPKDQVVTGLAEAKNCDKTSPEQNGQWICALKIMTTHSVAWFIQTFVSEWYIPTVTLAYTITMYNFSLAIY